MRHVALALIFGAAAAPLWAEGHEPNYDSAPTQACLEAAASYEERLQCVGASASACVEANGWATVVESYCYGKEAEDWDLWLNHAYQDALAEAKQSDAVNGPNAPSREEALRKMQRAWIAFRDATCEYEYSAWGGGTGGGPAYAACLMYETAQQYLYLAAGAG